MIKQYWFNTSIGLVGVHTGGGLDIATKELREMGYDGKAMIAAIEEHANLYMRSKSKLSRTRPIGPQRAAKKRKKL